MPRIDGPAGPIPVSNSATSSGKAVETVQLGESKLSEVAQRLGVDSGSLHQANPQIKDPDKLKVGQEVNLPQFQVAQELKQAEEKSLQGQTLHSSLPPAPLGDSLAKNAMQAKFNASDLSQVPGGAQQGNPPQLKYADKFYKSTTLNQADKWSKADKFVGADKPFQKADDLAQVAGGAGYADLEKLKEFGKAAQWKDAGKVVNAEKTIKGDKTAGSGKDFGKIDQAAKVFETTQDVTIQKAKTADKAFRKMDDYIRQ